MEMPWRVHYQAHKQLEYNPWDVFDIIFTVDAVRKSDKPEG